MSTSNDTPAIERAIDAAGGIRQLAANLSAGLKLEDIGLGRGGSRYYAQCQQR